MIPAVIYAAKSTADLHDSIGTQLQDGREIRDRNGWADYGEFVDEAFSAYTGPRGPALADALDAAERAAREHGEARFIIQHSDRLARGDGRAAPHLAEYVLRGRRNDVTFVSKQDPQTFSDTGLVYSALAGDRAHDDSSRKSQSVADGHRRRKVERKLHNGGPEKLGYRIVRYPDGEAIRGEARELDPAGARIVRRIYDAALDYVSQNQIARDLGADHVPTAQGGARWYQATVRSILTDPYYAGYLRSSSARKQTAPADEELIRGEHDPIVTLQEWRRVQQITAQRRTNGDGQPGRIARRPALFTHGHLRCGCCGAAMGVRHKTRRHGDREYVWRKYVCTARKDSHAPCAMTPVDADALDAMMLDEFRREPGQIVDRIRAAVTTLSADRTTTLDRLAEAERALAIAADAVDRVKRDYLAGKLAAEDYAELKARAESERAGAAAEAEQLRARAEQLQPTLVDDVDAAVERVMTHISEALADAARIEAASNIIRSAWPRVICHRDGDDVWLALGDVSASFAHALSSTNKYDVLTMISFVEQPAG